MARVRVPARSNGASPVSRRKKRSKRRWTAYAWVLLLLIPSVIFAGRWWLSQATWIYPSLGVTIPRGYGAVGIDVSRWNGRIHWPDVRSGSVRPAFVWIKATEGLKLNDPQYSRNRKGASEAGLVSGAYHYFHPSLDPLRQAQHCWKSADLSPGDLPPVLDLEIDGGLSDPDLVRSVQVWLDEMSRLCQCHPVIYTNRHFYKRVLRENFPDYTIWIAAYDESSLPLIQEDARILFWQFAQTGRVNGIREATDLNVFAGDTAALQTWLNSSWAATAVQRAVR